MKSSGFRDLIAVSRHPRVIFSVLISVALLVTFVTWDSWILLSGSVSSAAPSFFYRADRTRDLESLASRNGSRVSKVDHGNRSDAESQEITGSVQNENQTPGLKYRNQVSGSYVSSHDENSENIGPSEAGFSAVSVNSKVPAGTAGSVTSDDSDCDLYHGQWHYDPAGPLYTNNSCPVLTQSQNCLGNGRPDSEYENWRWKPFQCELPRFNATKFLELMSGKTVTFVGDSVARNQMESLLCLLWQVEAPQNRGNRRMQRWYFRSRSVTIIRIWSAWFVHHTSEPFSYVPEGVAKIHLDVPDEKFMELVPTSDVVVLSNGHWFTKASAYLLHNEIVGTQSWSPPEHHPMSISNIEAFRIATETILTALVTHPKYSGLTLLMSYSPDHYENGAWNTGGSCTGKVRPLLPGQLVRNNYTNSMHEKQLTGFNQAIKRITNQSKLKLMDITEAFGYRHDGHPGPYRSPDPHKITERGPNGRPPPQDCLHWCMPGPVDIWNELMLETIRREFEGGKVTSL